jgi:hypothetical protein
MVPGHPHPVLGGTVLSDEADGTVLTEEIHLHHGGVERAVALFLEHPTEHADHVGRGLSTRILGPGYHLLDIGIHVELSEALAAPEDFASPEEAGKRFVHVGPGKQREIFGQAFGDEIKPIALD